MGKQSPSGPPTAIRNPFPGTNSIVSGVTRFEEYGELGSSFVTEVEGQTYIEKSGVLTSLEVQIIQAGADAVNHTWSLRVNFQSQFDITMPGNVVGGDIEVGSILLAVGDLVSLRLVSGVIVGASPIVRTFTTILSST